MTGTPLRDRKSKYGKSKKSNEEDKPKPVAIIMKIIGDVKVNGKKAEWGHKLFSGDKVKTGEGSSSSIMYTNRSLSKIKENKTFPIKG
tara:strand:- start:214 stop:477 length:264 start_codon:yes stop_codon:yes gene_type:complete